MDKGSYYSHPKALVESDHIGSGTQIWAFAHILKGAIIGSRCNIGDHCYVENGVRIGNQVVIKNGVSIWDGLTIEDFVFIGPNVSFTNDLFPRAKVYHDHYETTHIREGASIGANATLLCGITLGSWCLVGAGSVVTKDVPDFAIVYGIPATVRGWVCKCGKILEFNDDKQIRCECGLGYEKQDARIICLSKQ